MPNHRWKILAGIAAATPLALTAAPALGAPRVVSAGFDRPTVVGRDLNLSVRAVDRARPVSGMSVAFGKPAQIFALSACRPAGSNGRAPGGPFAPGTPVTLSAPHRFSRTGVQAVVARIDSGGCDRAPETVYQPITATPTRPGQPPVPPVIGLPVPLPELLPKGPGLPGGLELPGLPDVAGSARAGLLAAAAGCRGARTGVRNDRRSRQAGRRALLCSVNAVRRRAGLHALRANARLRRAANAHSTSMVRRRYFSHVAPGGVVLITRLRRVRYLPARRWLVGENLASGRGRAGTPLAIVRAWLRSPPHRANLLEGSFREVGLGLAPGQPRGSATRGVTYTANFGFRR